MPPQKRKKMSGFTKLELRMAYQSVLSLLEKITPTDDSATSDDDDPDFKKMLAKALEMMSSKLDPHQKRPGDAEYKDSGLLRLKEDYEARVTAVQKLGKTDHWSSDGLYRHLLVLSKLAPRANEAASRAWIDAFFFRASAMMPQGKQLVLSLEQHVPATAVKPVTLTTLGGFIDYTAMSTSDAADFMDMPRLEDLSAVDHILFVSEAKSNSSSLEDNIPRAVSGMYVCATKLQKLFVRGAVTDGYTWIFLILKMNPNGDGAKYAWTVSWPYMQIITLNPPKVSKVSPTMCDIVSGIISCWIEHSNEDIGDNDWFCVNWK